VLSGESRARSLGTMNTATTPTRRPVIIEMAERERIWFFGGTVGVLATGADTDERYAIVEQHLPAGTATPLHAHLDDEESFVVLAGAVVYQVGDDAPVPVGVGGFIHVPAGVPHAFRVTDDGAARLLNITTPGHERFVRAAGDPAGTDGFPPAGPPDMPRVLAAADEFGTAILGPPPELA
jgi:quercetin dioxygenase-like cupin family protein